MNKNEVKTPLEKKNGDFEKNQLNIPIISDNEEKHINSHSQDSNFANDYTGTTIGKICSKTSKNFLLLLTIFIIIFIYYFYLHYNIVIIVSKSNSGLDYKFWAHKNLEDKYYLKAFMYFAIFHIFFIIFLISFYKAISTPPGYFSQEYIDIFSLKNKLGGEEKVEPFSSEDEFFDEAVFTNSDLEKIFEEDTSQDLESKIILIK
jgi:hypothetical protein